MDLTKLSGSEFNESGLFGGERQPDESAVDRFLADSKALTSSVGDLLTATRSRHGRQFTEERVMSQSASMPVLEHGGTGPPGSRKTKSKNNESQRGKAGDATAFNVHERPANRVDIAKLERELEVRVQAIVSEYVNMDDPSELADPRKDGMVIIRDQVLAGFNASLEHLQREPWLDTLIKCECVKITCDDIAKKLTDMLSVTSTELGNVLRKLRLAYMQTFEQMRASWQQLRGTFVEYEAELLHDRQRLRHLQDRLDGKDEGVRAEMLAEIDRMTEEFNRERLEAAEALADRDFKMEQMSETLVSLNGIFKNMQNDGTTVRMSDLTAKCKRLERENSELESKGMLVDKLKNDLEVAMEKIDELEKSNKSKDVELTVLNQQLVRREETVVALMERETLRNAEIEKMKDITGVQDDEELDITMSEPATSVLCIKCKKSLDDLSNIRAAILNKSDKSKIQCENYRILLPNLRGRRPNRSVEWIRQCMRCILVCKMREDVTLMDMQGECSSFSSFVYAWFSRPTDYMEGGTELKSQQQADEDRWGLYYGVKAMTKDNDPEATIFWTLLEESMGEDGLQFMFHCLSISLTMGGSDLWKQFGDSLTSKGVSINMDPNDKPAIRHQVWIDVGVAVEALKLILVRALKPHVKEAVDAIYAFRELPHVADPQMAEEKDTKDKKKKKDGEDEAAAPAMEGTEPAAEEKSADGEAAATAESEGEEGDKKKGGDEEEEPTHINLFVWLRLLLQQMQAEQIHRGAAVRLMCESASVGALTPQLSSVGDKDDLGSHGSQVEYPQFQLISKTLFPSISSIDTAALFIHCYDEGRRKVTADVILKVANRRGLFSKSMRLSVMPLLQSDVASFDIKEAVRLLKIENGEEGEEGRVEELADAAVSSGDAMDAAAAPPSGGLEEPSVDSLSIEGGSPESPATSPKRKHAGSEEVPLTAERQAAANKKDNEQRLRSQLGVLIHRKVAAILPDLELLLLRVSDRWRGVLIDARDGVIMALNDAFDKMRRVRMESKDEIAARAHRVDHYIDGIQPFVQYRRLLTTMLMVKAVSENPLLPSELFLGQTGAVLPNFNFAFRHVEDLLGSLEKSLVTSLRLDCVNTERESTTRNLVKTTQISERLAKQYYGDLGTSKVFRYEAARRNICARRLQMWNMHHFSSWSSMVPMAIRKHMSPGYMRRAPHIGNVRDRRVLRAPWWTQTLIAQAYQTKFEFDRTARQLGQPHLPLGHAVVACLYTKYSGVASVSERYIHDLCFNVRRHQLTSSRMKLFAAFCGFEDAPKAREEVTEEDAAADLFGEAHILRELLRSNMAVSVYMNLVCELHREVASVTAIKNRPASPAGEAGTYLKKMGILSGEDEVAPEAEAAAAAQGNPLLVQGKQVGGEGESKDGATSVAPEDSLDDINDNTAATAPASEEISPAVSFVPKIGAFIPSTEVGGNNNSKQDLWLLEPALLRRAALRWSSCIQGLTEEGKMAFADLTETVRSTSSDVMGRVNVDDFLWVMMQQWAKHTEYTLKKTASKATLALKNSLDQKVPVSLRLVRDAGSDALEGDDATEEEQALLLKLPSALQKRKTPKRVPRWTLPFLTEVAESVYKANDGSMPRLPDPTKAAVAYLSAVSAGTLRAHVITEITRMLRDMSVWDCNRGFGEDNTNPAGEGWDTHPASSFSVGTLGALCDVWNKEQFMQTTVADYLPSIADFLKERERFLKANKKFNSVLKKRLHHCKEQYKYLHTLHSNKSFQVDALETDWKALLELLVEVDDVLRLAVQVDSTYEGVAGLFPVDDTTGTAFVKQGYEEASEVYKISIKAANA
jgi:hypothetical protein